MNTLRINTKSQTVSTAMIAMLASLTLSAAACGGGAASDGGKKEGDAAKPDGGKKEGDATKPDGAGSGGGETAPPAGDLKVVAVETHNYSSYALMSDGTVRAWGGNDQGQLGNGKKGEDTATPVAIDGLKDVKSLIAGGSNLGGTTCAIQGDGLVKCWGDYELIPGGEWGGSPSPTEVSSLKGAKQISMGLGHACAVMADDTVTCWGRGWGGAMGSGTETDNKMPTAVAGLTGVRAVRNGRSHVCALLGDGSVKCWGGNFDGQTNPKDPGMDKNALSPLAIEGITGATAIGVGADTSCALLADKTVKCWGDGFRGEGVVALNNSSGTTGFSSGFGDHMCVLNEDGSARCFGDNYEGQLGVDSKGTSSSPSTPVSVPGLKDVASISTAFTGNHTCAATKDGNAYCWGDNRYGALGDATLLDHIEPKLVSSVTSASLPAPVNGFDKVPNPDINQTFDGLPAGCTHQASVEFKTKDSSKTAFEIKTAYARKGWESKSYTVDLRDYNIDPKESDWTQNPRGEQLWINMVFENNDVLFEGEGDAKQRKETKLVVEKASFKPRGLFNDPEPQAQPTVWASIYRNRGQNSVGSWSSSGVSAESLIELTYLGDDYVCGTITLTDNDSTVKGTFAAKVRE